MGHFYQPNLQVEIPKLKYSWYVHLGLRWGGYSFPSNWVQRDFSNLVYFMILFKIALLSIKSQIQTDSKLTSYVKNHFFFNLTIIS